MLIFIQTEWQNWSNKKGWWQMIYFYTVKNKNAEIVWGIEEHCFDDEQSKYYCFGNIAACRAAFKKIHRMPPDKHGYFTGREKAGYTACEELIAIWERVQQWNDAAGNEEYVEPSRRLRLEIMKQKGIL